VPVEGEDESSNSKTGTPKDRETAPLEQDQRSNREIVDDPSRQKLSPEEIEQLKREETGGGRDLIARLVQSHSAIAQKTNFSLAKYTQRKARKYLRRFTVLPLDVPLLARWLISEKEPPRILELREETLALIGSWANVRWSDGLEKWVVDGDVLERGAGRWLVVDETGGLVVAAMAERMGILYPSDEENADEGEEHAHGAEVNAPASEVAAGTENQNGIDEAADEQDDDDAPAAQQQNRPASHQHQRRRRRRRKLAMSARSNTITVLHANAQPNLSLLKYFQFDTSSPSPAHPLYTHLKSLSWLQLLCPDEDAGYAEPESVEDSVLREWKSGKRAVYFRKRRRWERVRSVVDEARAGAYDGLVVAAGAMSAVTILQHAVPLLRGGAPVVVYSPYVEPLAELADLYSTARRAAFVTASAAAAAAVTPDADADAAGLPKDDFPVNPSLLLTPMVQTVKVQQWQCLPERTHPAMTSRGGAEGYLFTSTRVLPAEGKVSARGKGNKRRKVADVLTGQEEDAKESAAEAPPLSTTETDAAKYPAESLPSSTKHDDTVKVETEALSSSTEKDANKPGPEVLPASAVIER
jgi:tRNA (adenine-N(1)-)-methyltransferase non-catalytic subunit